MIDAALQSFLLKREEGRLSRALLRARRFEWEALVTSMSIRGRRVEGFLPPLVSCPTGTLNSYAPSQRTPLVEGKSLARNDEDGAGVGGKGVADEASCEAAQYGLVVV